MKKFFSGLKTDPVNTLADWQDSRWPWGIIAFAMIAMVLLAHYVFQDWMHMLPCEQCVYIRYGNLVMALGCIIAMINPKALWAKVVGYVISLYGLVYTIMCSWKLIGIHDAVHSDDPMAMFGMQGCSTEPPAAIRKVRDKSAGSNTVGAESFSSRCNTSLMSGNNSRMRAVGTMRGPLLTKSSSAKNSRAADRARLMVAVEVPSSFPVSVRLIVLKSEERTRRTVLSG